MQVGSASSELLSTPDWAMRVFGPVVEVSAGSVPHIGQDFALGDPMAAQAIGDDLPRPVLQASGQALEEAFCCGGIPAVLDQDVEDDAVLVHRASISHRLRLNMW
jgi:hypothetical protein